MLYYAIKVLVSALLIVVAAEVAKRDTVFGGFIASLPLVSFTALVWLYVDTGDSERVAQLSHSIFWLVLPTLPFFLLLPVFLRRWPFIPSLLASTAVLGALYLLTVVVLKKN